MQLQIWEHLNHQAKQSWTNAEQAAKFVEAMLVIQKRENIRKEAYDTRES